MKDILAEIKEAKELCEVYTNEECTTKFSVGYVLAFDDDYVVLKMYDPNGHYDGIGCFSTDSIYEIDTDSNYLKALEKLIKHYVEYGECRIDAIDNIDKILSLIKTENRICEIGLCNSHNADVVGFIKKLSNMTIAIDRIDEHGKKSGHANVLRDAIDFLSFDSADMIKLEILQK